MQPRCLPPAPLLHLQPPDTEGKHTGGSRDTLQPGSSLLTASSISLLLSRPVPQPCLSPFRAEDITDDRNISVMLSFSSADSSSVSSAIALTGLSTFLESYTRNFSSFSPALARAYLFRHCIPFCTFLQSPAGFAKKNSELCCDRSLPFDPLFPLVTSTALSNDVILGITASPSVKFRRNSHASATKLNRPRERD